MLVNPLKDTRIFNVAYIVFLIAAIAFTLINLLLLFNQVVTRVDFGVTFHVSAYELVSNLLFVVFAYIYKQLRYKNFSDCSTLLRAFWIVSFALTLIPLFYLVSIPILLISFSFWHA